MSTISQQTLADTAAAARERRGSQPAIPLNLREFLCDEQRVALRKVESFGWRLAFVRRPMFQEPLVVVSNEDTHDFSVLEKDGSLSPSIHLHLRH